MREYDKAIADFLQYSRLAPNDVSAYGLLGDASYAKGDYDKAIAAYTVAIRLTPTNSVGYFSRGDGWLAKKEYDKAIADYNETLRLDPKMLKAYFQRLVALNAKKGHDNRGNALSSRKEYDKAIAEYDEAIRLDPKHGSAYNDRAWFRATCPDERYRDGQKAFKDASRASQLLGYKSARTLRCLAATYAETGDFEKAVEWQEKANKLYTDADDRKKGVERLNLYKDKKPYRETE